MLCILDPFLPGEDGATPMHFAARYRPQSVLQHMRSTQSTAELVAEEASQE